MPAIRLPESSDYQAHMNHLYSRDNFAHRERGVILVFVIVGIVGLAVLAALIYRWLRPSKKSQK